MNRRQVHSNRAGLSRLFHDVFAIELHFVNPRGAMTVCIGALIFLLPNMCTLADAQAISPAALQARGETCEPFFSNPLYLAGTNLSSIAVGDFNSDGIPDLVSAGWNTGDLYVLLGRKNGTFIPGGRVANVAALPRKVVVGDFNNDGKLDVALADESGSVNVLLGNGDGTFQPRVGTPAGNAVDYLAVGDFNHDGNLDVAAVSNFLSQVQVMLGKGDGTFEKPINYQTPLPSPYAVVTTDFNGDGKLDLAIPNTGTQEGPGSTVSVFFGKGDGTFGSPKVFDVGVMPYSILAADLNGDGNIDLATANLIDGTASVLLNRGNGDFRPARSYVAGHPFAPSSIAALSFDRGNLPGLAVSGVDGFFVLKNKGDGTFTAAQGYNPPAVRDLVVGDFNGDGKADLIMATWDDAQSPGVAVVFGQGGGAFSTSTAYVEVQTIDAAAVADFDGDHKADLAVADTFDGEVGIAFGDGKGHFQQPSFEYNVSYPVAIAAGTFRRGKKPDLAVLSWPRFSVQILLNNGNGSFTEGEDLPISAVYPTYITLADFNRDGILDLAVTSQGDYADEGAVSILLGNGDGTFQSAVTYGSGMYLRGAVFGDFNGNHKLDFILPRYDDSDFVVFLGQGDGTFREGKTYAMPAKPMSAVAGDFNGDGNLDLAVSLNNGTIQVWLGSGNGTFHRGTSFTGGSVMNAVDLNHDGKVDLATVNSRGMVQILLGRGDGTFRMGNSSYYGGGGSSSGFALSDLTGNGAHDLVFPAYWAGTVSVLLNHCVR